MSINDSPSIRSEWPQFGIRSLLWLTVVVALILACVRLSQRLQQTQQALARTAWAASDVSIPAGKFRLMVNKILDDQGLKVCVVRFEANRECYVSVGGQSCMTSPMENGETHWAEIKVVGNFDKMDRHFTLLTRVGSAVGHAGGKSTYPLAENANVEQFLSITVEPGMYDLNEPIEIYREDRKPVVLTVK
jgi:hypothetical protein